MLRKLIFWLLAAPFIVMLVIALLHLAVALFGLYFLMELLGAPEAEWSA